tara:strand:- start:691 stop:1155 length:465 start_codon:yes stop_codon:yes gene_type:complete
MKNIVTILLFFFFYNINIGYSSNGLLNDISNLKFDAVEKKLVIDDSFPNFLLKNINYWFDNKIKVNGIDGKLIFKISSYSEKISQIDNGKKVDITFNFEYLMQKSKHTKNTYKAEINSYGTMSGDFSLNDFDKIIETTQLDLIFRLSDNLKLSN